MTCLLYYYIYPSVVDSLPGLVPGAVPEDPALELIAQAAEEKVRAEMKSEEQAKELQVLHEENNRLRNEIKVLQEYMEKAHRNFAVYVMNKRLSEKLELIQNYKLMKSK